MNETIEDIIREMREGVVAKGWMEQTLREFADRIERAFAMHAKVVEQHETNYTTQKEVTK